MSARIRDTAHIDLVPIGVEVADELLRNHGEGLGVHLRDRPPPAPTDGDEIGVSSSRVSGGQLSFVETADALSERAHERHLVSCQHDERARDMSGGA